MGLDQGALKVRKEDYFKINACPGIRWWWLDQGEVLSIALNKKTTGGATNKMVRKDGWPDAAWPNFLGRQHQLQPFSILVDE